MLDQGLHLVTRFNGSATKHLVHVGLNDLELVSVKCLATAILQKVKDLEHDAFASLFTRRYATHVEDLIT